MNPLSLGLRNFLGVLLPGTLLILVLVACMALLVPDARPLIASAFAEKATLGIAAVLLVSYVVGSVIRLYAADTVDRLSAGWARLRRDPIDLEAGTAEEKLHQLLKRAIDPAAECPSAEVARWAWMHDKFPYPVWQCMKFRLYHPREMLAFYGPYIDCFAVGGRRGKEFFNYCKSVIFSANPGATNLLADEVRSAEANVRFFAGTFWAVVLSVVSLLTTALLLRLLGTAPRGAVLGVLVSALLTAAIGVSIVASGRFRLLRLKEVDTVFDAFYLVHRHAIQCPQCNRMGPSTLSDERRQLVEDAFCNGVSLTELSSLMRKRSQANPLLSCLYFAGADHDHPYFLDTDRLAVGLSVLPEDDPKSSVPKCHPHQNEVIVVLDGELSVEVLRNGSWQDVKLSCGQVLLISPGEYHKILSRGKRNAAFLFVKTNPAEEPREQGWSEVQSRTKAASNNA